MELVAATAMWSNAQWATDIASMKAVGMTFFVLPHPAIAAHPPTSGCPLGRFNAYFDTSGLGDCFAQIGPKVPGGAAMVMLAEAANAGMKLHIGLALTQAASDPYNASLVPAYAALQGAVARHLWNLADRQGLTGSIAGFYTEVEEYNAEWWVPEFPGWTKQYLEPLAAAVKALRADLLVWASPYSVGNLTRYDRRNIVDYVEYGQIWERVFNSAPHFDLVSPQDARGAQGNSAQNASDCLGNVSLGAKAAGRATTWSNVELFETWGPQGSGRHPAPFERFRSQMEDEWRVLQQTTGEDSPTLIAWEWHSCLSPNGAAAGFQWAGAAKANYAAYREWITPPAQAAAV